MLGLLYIALALGGTLFVVFSAVTGMGDGGHIGHVGHDVHGDSSEGAPHFTLLSPLTLAILFASIGAFGLITRYGFGLDDGPSIILSVIGGLGTAYVVARAAGSIIMGARGTSAIKADAFVGSRGEVITSIPVGGVGEVALLLSNQRYTSPARSADGSAIATGAAVTVVRLAGTTLVVAPA
jgi:hypothetical protein